MAALLAEPFSVSSIAGGVRTDMYFNIFKNVDRSEIGVLRWAGMLSIIAITTVVVMYGRPRPSRAAGSSIATFCAYPADFLQVFGNHRATLSGRVNGWKVGCEKQDRYALHWGEDDGAGLLKRKVPFPLSSDPDDALHHDSPVYDVRRNLNRSPPEETDGTGDKSKNHIGAASRNSPFAALSVKAEFRVYLVRRGDSLWKIAKRFGMKHRTLAKVNELGTNAMLEVGRPLKVKTVAPQELTLSFTDRDSANDPVILNTIRMTDGRPVPPWLVKDFTAEVVEKPSTTSKNAGGGAIRYPMVIVSFRLAKNPLEAQARRFQPIVLAHAAKYNLDPALIMAMIHTESFFNPHSRSKASACGLMQLVPHTAGLEAYGIIYGKSRKLTPEYLFDPDNNIELGTAYLHILKEDYMGSIADPVSRTYCAVAAYHAGPSNVGRAFIPKPSIRQAIPVINRLSPADVYKRLVEALPTMESRNYVRKVMARFSKYRSWYPEDSNARTPANSGHVRL